MLTTIAKGWLTLSTCLQDYNRADLQLWSYWPMSMSSHHPSLEYHIYRSINRGFCTKIKTAKFRVRLIHAVLTYTRVSTCTCTAIIAGVLTIMTCYCSCSPHTWRFQGVKKQLLFLRNELHVVRGVRSGGVITESALSSL